MLLMLFCRLHLLTLPTSACSAPAAGVLEAGEVSLVYYLIGPRGRRALGAAPRAGLGRGDLGPGDARGCAGAAG